jgi:hypothetical protein
MPELVWLYLTALVYYRTSGSCVAVAEALETVSHDRLTRMLPGDWSGHARLDLAVRMLFTWRRGYLIIGSATQVMLSQEHPTQTGFVLKVL